MDFTLAPTPVESGSDLRFELVLFANAPVRLNAAVLILNALEGPRLGIVDLRSTGFPFEMKTNDCLRIEGLLRSIPLVERQYRIALWLDFRGIFRSGDGSRRSHRVSRRGKQLVYPLGTTIQGLVGIQY